MLPISIAAVRRPIALPRFFGKNHWEIVIDKTIPKHAKAIPLVSLHKSTDVKDVETAIAKELIVIHRNAIVPMYLTPNLWASIPTKKGIMILGIP